jgi:hypothetical protein
MAIVLTFSSVVVIQERGRLLVSESCKMLPVKFLRIDATVAISRERKCPPQSASPAEIECCIRVVKKLWQATRHILPFERIPKIMTVHI